MKQLHIIVCFTHKTFGIGKDGELPWNIKEDLKYFKTITDGSICVMGYNTYQSILKSKNMNNTSVNNPLPNRTCIVITTDQNKNIVNITDDVLPHNEVIFMNIETFERWRIRVMHIHKDIGGDIFIIGGERLYKDYMVVAKTIYTTILEKEYECDTFYPIDKFHNYHIESYSERLYSKEEDCYFRHITYTKKPSNVFHDEFRYINLLDSIIFSYEGVRPDRTGIGTKSLFGKQLHFDISKSIPLITTKFVPWKMVLKELLWFMKGKTDSKLLEEQGVNIWRDNTSREFLDMRGLSHYKEGDIGPMYGFNWRYFNAEYKGCESDYKGQGYDQLQNLIDGLRNDPYSRRHMITTFNPSVIDQSVLAPCHGIVVQFFVEEEDNKKHLSCHMYQRSCDSALGLVFNIASYAIFTNIIAKMCDMYPKELIISTGDTHIYVNHIQQVTQQLYRQPLPFPILEISDVVKNKKIEELSIDDFNIVGYLHHPSIQLPMAV